MSLWFVYKEIQLQLLFIIILSWKIVARFNFMNVLNDTINKINSQKLELFVVTILVIKFDFLFAYLLLQGKRKAT